MLSRCVPVSSSQLLQSISHQLGALARFESGLSKAVDVAVVGGGPGGYVAAIKAAQAGFSVACVDERGSLGGTCLNVGCIPTKALLSITHHHEVSKTFHKLGLPGPSKDSKVDFPVLQKNKENIVQGLAKGIEFLFKKNKVQYIRGTAKLVGPRNINVNGQPVLEAKHVILAPGSVPAPMPGGFLPFDEKKVLSSTGILALRQPPRKLLIVGGGAIGLEFATLFARLGTQVEVIEFMPQIAVGFDADISQVLQKLLQKAGVKLHLNAKVVRADLSGDGVRLAAEMTKDGNRIQEFEGDVVLVSVGRMGNSKNLGLEHAGVDVDRLGKIPVDDTFSTNVTSIKAIGDVIAGPMLAHKAEEDACAAVSALKGHPEAVDYDSIPAVIYTHPEVAAVGKGEDALKKASIAYKKGVFPMMGNSRARANQDAEGLVKILVAEQDGRILGASIVAPNAGDLIQELVLAKRWGIKAKQIADTSHAHPTLSEAIKEAAMAVSGKPIHL